MNNMASPKQRYRYYIEYDSGRHGPLDLLGIIRKIRNGSLHKNDLVLTDMDEQPKPAYHHQELYEAFIEQDRIQQEAESLEAADEISFGQLLKAGFSILKDDQAAMMIAGLFLLATIMTVGVLAITLPPFVAAIIAPLPGVIYFQLCLVVMLRVSRVQLLSGGYFSDLLRNHGISLLLASLPVTLIAFSLPWLLSMVIGMGAWAITVFIGLPLIAYCFFVPVLIVDREMTVKQAFLLNHTVVKSLGISLFSLVIGMMLLNLAAALLVIMPLFTLPVTLLALMVMYDSYFNDY